MKYLLLVLICFVTMALSCKKEIIKPQPVDESFPVKFIFVNHDTAGRDSLRAVILKSFYYNKIVDSSHIGTTIYATSPTALYPYKDSIVHREFKGIKGSRKAFQIDIAWFYTDSLGDLRAHGYVYKSNLYQYGDTMETAKDGIEIFRFPEDTSRYILLEKY